MSAAALLLERKRQAAREILERAGTGSTLPDGAAAAIAGARARFLDSGAPVRRDEYWKYTDPARMTAAPAKTRAVSVDPFAALTALRVRADEAGVCTQDSPSPGLEVTSLAEAVADPDHWASAAFATLERAGQEPVARPFAALNTALFDNGVALRACGSGSAPVHLLRTAPVRGGTAYGRVLVRVEEGADLTLVETDLDANARNLVLEAEVAAGGRLHHLRVQGGADRLESTGSFVQLGAGAEYRGFVLSTDGALTRNETVLTLAGPQAKGHIAGAVLGRGRAVIDNTILVIHEDAGGESRQVFKAVLDEQARGVFQGKVLVRQEAQQTDGYQISRAVLLGERAEFDSKPELEIYADDVKCSHGSTAGQLDETALFYLRSRGIPRPQAESLLVAAFVEEAIEEIALPELASVIRDLAAAWMQGRPTGNTD